MVYEFQVSIALLTFCPIYLQIFLDETVKMISRKNQELGFCNKVVSVVNRRYKSMRTAAEIVIFSPTLRGMALVSFFYELGMSAISSVLLVCFQLFAYT